MLASDFTIALLIHLHAWEILLLSVGLCIGIGIGGLLLTRRLFPHLSEGENNVVATVMATAVATIFAVLAGFIVVTLYTTSENATQATHQETGALLNVYRESTAMSFELATTIQADVLSYSKLVATDEFPAMARGGSSRQAEDAASQIFTDLSAFQPTNQAQSDLMQEALGQYDTFLQARRARLALAESSLPGMLWLSILTSAGLTIAFSWFFGQDRLRAQLFMTGGVAAIVGIMIFLIVVLNHPFTGDYSVSSLPFTEILRSG